MATNILIPDILHGKHSDGRAPPQKKNTPRSPRRSSNLISLPSLYLSRSLPIPPAVLFTAREVPPHFILILMPNLNFFLVFAGTRSGNTQAENRKTEKIMRAITLAYAPEEDESEEPYCVEVMVPRDDKSCVELIDTFVKAYEKARGAVLKRDDLELLKEDGTVITTTTRLRDVEMTELMVALTPEAERKKKAPVLLLLGEISTVVGLAGEPEPRATVPTYVAEAFVENVLCTTLSAGGAVDELFCKNPGHSEAYYPVGSESVKVHQRDDAAEKTTITRRGWNDIELIVRHALIRADLELGDRHVVAVVPSRATKRFKSDLAEFLFKQHGAASVAVAPLSVAALTATTGHWATTGLVLDLGHDSSSALAIIDGKEVVRRTTLRGGALVSDAFLALRNALNDHRSSSSPSLASLAKTFTTKDPSEGGQKVTTMGDVKVSHKVHLDKARHCVVRSGNNVIPRSVLDGVLLGDAAFIPAEVLFTDDGRDPVHRITADAITRCDPRRHDALFATVVATGWDDACLPGVEHRLAHELHRLIRATKKIKAFRATAWSAALEFAALLSDPHEASLWIMVKDDILKDPR